MIIKTTGNSTLLVCLLLALSACAGVPAPTSEIALSEAAIKDAETAGARKLAPLEFRRANEKFAEANKAMQEEDYSLAHRLCDEARVEAELAEAKSYVEKLAIEMQTMRANIDTLTRQSGI